MDIIVQEVIGLWIHQNLIYSNQIRISLAFPPLVDPMPGRGALGILWLEDDDDPILVGFINLISLRK